MKVIVCGAGQVGTTIARHLSNEGMDVTVIDLDEAQVRRVDERYDVRGVVGHASHPATLARAGARDADMLIAVTRSDEVNMVACQVAYSLFRVKRRIARLRHAGYLAQDKTGLYAAEHLPIDVIISPEMQVADGIAHRLRTPGAFDRASMAGGRLELLGVHLDVSGCAVVGRSVEELAAPGRERLMTVVAVVRKGRAVVPGPQDRLELGDDVYVVAPADRAEAVVAAFGHREKVARSIVIVGAGNVGVHLAHKLKRTVRVVSVKIIEQDAERADVVARELGRGVVVLQGDALDRQLLDQAQVGAAETIVAVTNDDETNIFVSVLGKQAGCKRAVTLVNKPSYEALIPTLGIDAVVSPSTVTISTVLRHVRRGTITGLHTLREDFGEVIEAEIGDGSRLLREPIGGLGLPPGVRIAALVRNGRVIMPEPETVLERGDVVTALVTYSYLRFAEALFGDGRGRFR